MCPGVLGLITCHLMLSAPGTHAQPTKCNLLHVQGIPPQQILYLAFNRTAVSDARARLAKMNIRIWAQQARTIDSWALSVVTQFAQVSCRFMLLHIRIATCNSVRAHQANRQRGARTHMSHRNHGHLAQTAISFCLLQHLQVLGFAGRPRLTLVSSESAMAVMKAAVKRAVLSAELERAVTLLGLAEGASWDDVVAACREQRPADYDR